MNTPRQEATSLRDWASAFVDITPPWLLVLIAIFGLVAVFAR